MEQRPGAQPVRRVVLPIGRASELREVEGFLSSIVSGQAMVLYGEPGIGKSLLWEAAVERGRSLGFAMLCARASEAEAQLPFAGLADLLEGVDSDVLADLPAPQRHALDVAVRRAEPGDRVRESLAIPAGLLGALRLLSIHQRLLVAIDDLRWLDRPSAAALMFAARRLAGHDVRYLVTRRDGPSSELERVLEPAGMVVLELGPLSFRAINRLLKERLGQSLPRRVCQQVFDASRGNPLFAVELGRAVLERGLPEIGAALPVPAMLNELFGARVAALPTDVRRALLAVALSPRLRIDGLAAVVDPLVIEDAVASGVLIVDGTDVRASPPLLAAAAARRSTARERRELHLALADVVGDELLRTRHLAMAAAAPDGELAGELSSAAARAAGQGSVGDAAELAGHALRLTPPGQHVYDERLLALARYLYSAGEHPRASALLADRIAVLPRGPARAAAHLVLGAGAAELSVEEDHLERAVAESAADPEVRAQALARQAQLLVIQRVGRIGDAERLAREALALAGSAGPDAERRALVALAWARIMRGCAIDDLVARSARLGPLTSSLYEGSVERPAGVRLAFRGDLAQARSLFRRLLASADARGESRSGTVFIVQLAEVELRAGHTFDAAHALEELEQWSALEPQAPGVQTRVQAVLAAVRGEPGRATALANWVLDAGEPIDTWDRLEAQRVDGLAALLERHPARAAGSLAAVWDHTLREGIEELGAFPVVGDLIEALVESSRLEQAKEAIERLARLASQQQHPWALATLKRSRAMVTLADGHDDAAAAELAQAAAGYSMLGCDFEGARTLLFLGRVQRRFNKRTAARQSLEQARSAFDQLGCPGWEQAATAELRRVSGRRAAPEGTLTPSEQRVAELVASGLSNKEVAAQLFVSVYTVEAHLSSVYAKLGIRSRVQLARRLGTSA